MSNNLLRTELTANQNQKTVSINNSDGIIDAKITEFTTLDFTSGNVTLTDTQHTQNCLFRSSNLSTARNLTVAARKAFFFVDNAAGTDTLTVVRGATTVAVAAGENGIFYTDGTTDGLLQLSGGGSSAQQVVLEYALSDETTAITTGTAKLTTRVPFACTLDDVRASLTGGTTTGTLTVDINEGGATVLSTKLTIDATETTSTTAATPAVISDSTLADDAELTFDVDDQGDGTATGLKVRLYVTPT
jgi:hypothetical protein